MNRRSTLSRITPALATLVALAGSQPANAHEPSGTTCQAAEPPAMTHWPLWERPAVVTEFPADILDLEGQIEPRTHVWNSFGEFQYWTSNFGHYLHTGIDINADATHHFGDWVVAAADGYIWAVHSFHDDFCTDNSRCKLYIRDASHRYIYYYAHLRMRDSNSMSMGVEFDSAMRERINHASKFTGPDMDTDPNDDGDETDDYQMVSAGEVVSGVGEFTGPGWAHLHFAVMDACENYDGLSPLDHLSPPGFFDDTPPVVEQVKLVADLGGQPTIFEKCDEITEPFDIVAQVYDVWRPDGDPQFHGNQRLGVDKATYRLTNLTAQDDPAPVVWYDFDQLPFRCAGPVIGAACPDPTAIVTQAGSQNAPGLLTELSLEFPPTPADPTAGPFFAHTFTEALFSVLAPFASQSHDYEGAAMKNFAILNNAWGVDSGPIDPAILDPGLYQVVAEVFDTRGLARAKASFFVVPGGSASTANLVIRDHEFDDGSIPSNAGGQKHWRSTNIKVGGAKPAVNDPVWDEVQDIEVTVGDPTKVYVRVENHGCDTITDDWEVKVGSTQPSLISTSWVEIGSVTSSTDLAPGAAEVVEIDWIPVAGQAGHRCMLAAVQAPDDPSKVPLVAGQMDFTQLDVPSSEIVPLDSNLAQRNLTISNSPSKPFILGNPFGSTIDFGIEFDCNELPIELAGASVVLHFDKGTALDTAWASVPRVTVVSTPTGAYTSLAFEGCKVSLPAVSLAANTLVDAWVQISLPGSLTGTWDIDLKATVDGVLRDGMSVRHTQ